MQYALFVALTALVALAGGAGCAPARASARPLAVVTVDLGAEAPKPSLAPSAVGASAAPERVMAWLDDADSARERAKRDGRPMLVFIRADWSVASLAAERDIWTEPRVVEAARRFLPVRVDVTETSNDDADGELARWDVTAVPAILVFDGDGRRVASLSGPVELVPLLATLSSAE